MQGVKKKGRRRFRGHQDVAPGSQIVTDLDLFAGLIIIYKDVSGVGGDNGRQGCGPQVQGVFLADGGAHLPQADPPGQVPGLRGEMPGQPDELQAPEC